MTTEREYVIQQLAHYADEVRPGVSLAELAGYLRRRCGPCLMGGSGWLPHVPRGHEEFYGPDGRVRPEWLRPEHLFRYACTTRGVYLGEMCHMRRNAPDIAWEEIADYALHGQRPRQLSMFEEATA